MYNDIMAAYALKYDIYIMQSFYTRIGIYFLFDTTTIYVVSVKYAKINVVQLIIVVTIISIGSVQVDIPILTKKQSITQLDNYVSRGNCLRQEVQYISVDLQVEMMRVVSYPRLFYFVEASSGMGKSQLAASLSLPVVYIPLSTSQLIYECFYSVSQAINEALNADFDAYSGVIDLKLRSANDLGLVNEQFKIVGLLVSLFKAVCGVTNEESLKVLSGYYGGRTMTYYPMTISEAKSELRGLIRQHVSQSKTPIFFIDEVPSYDSENDLKYRQCVFLRNIIRNLNCICMLSGTEAALMNAFDNIYQGSRRDGVDTEYLRLILKLPNTNFEAICCDSKYIRLLQSISPDVSNMLRSTRPLFAQYIMDAMIICHTSQLTARVLSKAKEQIVENKEQFSSNGGLFGQMAILHPKFISNTIDNLRKGNKNKGIEKFLVAQKQSCIEHHFGKISMENSDESIVSLYLASDYIYTKNVDGVSIQRSPFEPNIDFELPSNDPLLYMICIRDGLYGKNIQNRKCRISSTRALSLLSKERIGIDFPLFGNPNQISCTGRFLEMECLSAAIIASHAYPNSLSGCPFDCFLRSFIAELNPSPDYVSFDGIENIPSVYADVKVTLLSPANCNWRENNRISRLQNSSIVLGACNWSCNADKNDGTISLFTDLTASLIGAIETQCYRDNVPSDELTKTMRNLLCNDNLITIMIVTKFGKIRSWYENFHEVTKDVVVAMVEGNANKGRPVANELAWKRLDIRNVERNVTPKRTVIIVVLESIYYNRYASMAFAYQKN